jgi:hypothetical protein
MVGNLLQEVGRALDVMVNPIAHTYGTQRLTYLVGLIGIFARIAYKNIVFHTISTSLTALNWGNIHLIGTNV